MFDAGYTCLRSARPINCCTGIAKDMHGVIADQSSVLLRSPQHASVRMKIALWNANEFCQDAWQPTQSIGIEENNDKARCEL